MATYRQITHNGHTTVTILFDDATPKTITDGHLGYQAIMAELSRPYPDEDRLRSLLDARHTRDTALTRASNRVSIDGDTVLFDGQPVHNAISAYIVRLLRQGHDAKPAALFMERLAANPSANVRHRLWDWLESHDFTLTPRGFVVGYKAVCGVENLSISSGREPVLVGDETYTGRIPYPVGVRVSMNREQVDPNRNNGCSVGLHIGTWDYAATFGAGRSDSRILTVEFDPADVVSVPSEDARKLRVCALRATGVTLSPVTDAVYGFDDDPIWPTFDPHDDEPDPDHDDEGDDWE